MATTATASPGDIPRRRVVKKKGFFARLRDLGARFSAAGRRGANKAWHAATVGWGWTIQKSKAGLSRSRRVGGRVTRWFLGGFRLAGRGIRAASGWAWRGVTATPHVAVRGI